MPRTSRRRVAVAALAASLAAGGHAEAHAVVVASDPPAGAVLAAAPSRVTVRFNSRIDHGRSRLTLVGPDAEGLVLEAGSGADPVAMDAPVPDALAPGAWRLRWQVLAVDGHITRGDIPFTIQAR